MKPLEQKGHNYVSVFVDLDNSKVIHVCEGRDSETIGSFNDDYENHHGSAEKVTNFCCDMSPAFIFKRNTPQLAAAGIRAYKSNLRKLQLS